MICFPNAKINIGLRILEKRPDGYHNIESIFYPVGWCDALEAIPMGGSGKIELHLSGIPVPGRTNNDNLCVKLYKLLLKKYKLPSLKVWLHKTIPIGAGLGGGSSDAAHFMKMLNEMCDLKLSADEMKEYIGSLGSDCVFFIENRPVIAFNRGDVTEAINLDLSSYHIGIGAELTWRNALRPFAEVLYNHDLMVSYHYNGDPAGGSFYPTDFIYRGYELRIGLKYFFDGIPKDVCPKVDNPMGN